MLDSAALATMVTSLLVPATPYLLKGGEQAWGEASKKIGPDVWEWTKAIWIKLLSRSKSKLKGEETTTEIVKAATEVVSDPSDVDAQAALRFHIKKLLTNDSELRSEIIKVLDEVKASSAKANVRIGVNISDGATVNNTGDIVGGNKISNP